MSDASTTTTPTRVLTFDEEDVLYLDYENDTFHPLSNIYHATASNHLTSSTTTLQHIEIDSTYCPQCLSCQPFIGSRSEAQSYCSTSPHYCKQCPICHIPLRVSCRPSSTSAMSSEQTSSLVVTYQCGYCRYDSGFECGIETSYDTTTTDSKNLLAEELHKSFLEQTNHDSKTNEVSTFNALVQGWKHKVENDANMKSLQQFQMRGNIVFKPAAPQETIEKAPFKDKQYSSSTCYRTDSILTQQEFQTYYQESSKYVFDKSQHHLVPQRISLIPRVSKRDPLEVSKGKPGLLMKPKLNILDGDSSQRRYGNYGQWFKKDCSAVHTIPKLSLVKQQVNSNHTAFLMKLHNPTMGRIRIRVGVITVTQESDESTSTSFIRKNVLLNGYQRKVLRDIELIQPMIHQNSSFRLTSDWMEVDQSEGALGGLGIDHLASVGTTTNTSSSTTADGNENMIQSWNGTNILNAMMEHKDSCLFQTNLLKQDGDVIWFECAIHTTEGSNQQPPHSSKGTMFTLHVQSLEEGGVAATGTGNNDDDDGDYMKFHLLVPWRNKPQNE